MSDGDAPGEDRRVDAEPGYAVVPMDAVPVTDMADLDAVPPQFDPLDVRNVDEVLGLERTKVKVWRLPPGSHMGVHGHETQEECYYVLRGRLLVDLGSPGETETVEVGPGTWFAAEPRVARGYENVGEEEALVLVVSAPNVEDRGIPESELDAESVEE